MCKRDYMVEGCPWCGEYPDFSYLEVTGEWYAECTNLECPALPSVSAETIAGAVAKWNGRKGAAKRQIVPSECPHCGGRAVLAEGERGFAVKCLDCNATMPGGTILGAVELWNRRA